MIRTMFNLRCASGHYHFSPTPELWAGRACAKPFGDPLRADGMPRVKLDKCESILRRVRVEPHGQH